MCKHNKKSTWKTLLIHVLIETGIGLAVEFISKLFA